MPVPVISLAQMREWERVTWTSGESEDAVMHRAGRVVGQAAQRLLRSSGFILVVAGKGHNGDDASYAADYLREAGLPVEVLRILEPETGLPACDALLQRRPVMIIDGLFGIGLNRNLNEGWVQVICRLNQSEAPILSVDVPSGLNAQTGLPQPEAIRATWTVTLGAIKQGLLEANAWPYVGRLIAAPEIGLVPYPFITDINFITSADFQRFPPPRAVSGHKGTYGHLAIVAGSLGYHGAAVLAARGAQRARPGLITVLTAPEVYMPVASQLQSTMVHPWTTGLELPKTCTAILVGPGLAATKNHPGLKDAVRRLWLSSPLAMIVDASALEWLPEGPCAPEALRLITPHPGEAARLLGVPTGEVQADRVHSLRELSRRWGQCHVILKGHQTLVGRVREPLYVNSTGNPYLAQGGSGDLLGGYVAGLLAQPELRKQPAKTITYAVWQHGAAADQLADQRTNWTIEDLANHLGQAQEIF